MSVPAAYAVVLIVWSTTPLAIVWSSESFEPNTAAGLRLLLSLLIVLGLRPVLKSPALNFAKFWKSYAAAAVGLFPCLALVYWSALYLPSALISVLFGLCPFAVVLLNVLMGQTTVVSFGQVGGIVIAFIGLCIVMTSGTAVDDISLIGLILVLASVGVYAISTTLVKAYSRDVDLLNQLCGALLLAVPFFVLTWLLGGAELPESPAFKSIYAIVYLAVAGSALSYVAYFYLLKHVSVAAVSLIPMVTPVIALFLGVFLNGEQISTYVFVGVVCILTGLWVFRWLAPKTA